MSSSAASKKVSPDKQKVLDAVAVQKKLYMDIAEKVKQSKGKSDPKVAAASIEKCMAAIAKADAEKPADDAIDAKEGVMLDGCGGAVLSVGELEVSTDCLVDVPRVAKEKEEEADDPDARSLWGDGDDEPGAEEE